MADLVRSIYVADDYVAVGYVQKSEEAGHGFAGISTSAVSGIGERIAKGTAGVFGQGTSAVSGTGEVQRDLVSGFDGIGQSTVSGTGERQIDQTSGSLPTNTGST